MYTVTSLTNSILQKWTCWLLVVCLCCLNASVAFAQDDSTITEEEQNNVILENKTSTPKIYPHVLDTGVFFGATLGYAGISSVPIQSTRTMATPQGLDAALGPQWDPRWDKPSDFLGDPTSLYGFNLPVLTTVGMITLGARESKNTSIEYGLTMAQSITITALITESIKRTVGRPRPYTSAAFATTYPDVYATASFQEMLQDPDSYKSFPSGHTSNAAATYFTAAGIIAGHTTNQTTQILSYSTATALTILTGWSRIQYGKHHPTDTIMGACIGTSVALGVVYWHDHRNN